MLIMQTASLNGTDIVCRYLEPLKHRKYGLAPHNKKHNYLFKLFLIKNSEMDSYHLKVVRFICLV